MQSRSNNKNLPSLVSRTKFEIEQGQLGAISSKAVNEYRQLHESQNKLTVKTIRKNNAT